MTAATKRVVAAALVNGGVYSTAGVAFMQAAQFPVVVDDLIFYLDGNALMASRCRMQ